MKLDDAIEVLRNGGVVGFPTDTVYGIGCDVFNAKAAEKIFSLKQREKSKPLAAHVGSWEQIEMVAQTHVPFFDILREEFLPGPLAIVLPKLPAVPDVVTCGLATISIRYPDCPEAIELALGLGSPIAATSANLSGKPSAIHHNDVKAYFPTELDFIVEAGYTKYRKESTIIDLTKERPEILRIGVISKEQIEDVLKTKL